MKLFLGALALAVLSGCVTSQIPAEKAKSVPEDRVLSFQSRPSGPYGTILVTRDTGLFGSGCFLAVHVDGQLAARIDTGEVVSFFVPVGDHLVGMGSDKKGGGMCSWTDMLKEQSASVKSGQVKRFRIGGDSQAGFDIRPSSL
jgi:hypothetical protein